MLTALWQVSYWVRGLPSVDFIVLQVKKEATVLENFQGKYRKTPKIKAGWSLERLVCDPELAGRGDHPLYTEGGHVKTNGIYPGRCFHLLDTN